VFHKIGVFDAAIDVHPYWDRSFDRTLALAAVAAAAVYTAAFPAEAGLLIDNRCAERSASGQMLTHWPKTR
jgi:hypothetical protein